MGNSPSVVKQVAPSKKCSMIVERLVDGNCDFIKTHAPFDPQIKVGLCGQGPVTNPLGNQCIRIGNDALAPLVNFEEHKNSLQYTFSNDIHLSINKRDTGEVYYHLKTPEYNETRMVSDSIRKFYKPISGDLSIELDKIVHYYK